MQKITFLKLTSIALAVAFVSGCATQLNVPPSTRVKVFDNPNSKYSQPNVLVPGQKFKENSNFVIVDTANAPVDKIVRFVADNGNYIEVNVAIVAKVKDDPKSVEFVANNITPSILDSRGVPFIKVWDAYASNPVEIAIIDFFNRPENQNISTISNLSNYGLDKQVKNSVASTPIEITNLSVIRSIITAPEVMQFEEYNNAPVKHIYNHDHKSKGGFKKLVKPTTSQPTQK